MTQGRKLENSALVLPVFGAVLIVPPVLSVFNIPLRLWGLPVSGLYLFAVWVVLVGAALFLSRQLSRRERASLLGNGGLEGDGRNDGDGSDGNDGGGGAR